VTCPRSTDQRGGVFVIAAFVLLLGTMLVLASGPLIGAIVGRARASAAADAAALAAADAVVLGRGERAACIDAAAVARANDARMVDCVADSTGAAVVVEVRAAPLIPTIRGRARAEIDWTRA
jgi:secretion/DNA translocation related TadE-like protein